MTDSDGISVLAVTRDGTFESASDIERADDRLTVRSLSRSEATADRLADRSPDCVVVDQGLDNEIVDRVETAQAIDAPIVVLAGSVGLAESALESGATDVVRIAGDRPNGRLAANRIATVVERERARATADRRQSRFEALLENSSDRLSVLDERARYTFVSPSMERLVGHEPAALLGESGFEYVHPEDCERVEAAFERVLTDPDETVSVEYRFRDANGEWRWIEARGTNYLDDPAVAGIVVNSREITDRKEQQRRLGEERAFTESIFAALPDVLYAFDEHGNFLRWNDRLSEVTGYDDDEIASMHPTEFIADPDRTAVVDAIMQVLEEDTTVTVEARFETKGGERIPYEFTGAKVTDPDGEALGLVGVGRDISGRKERQRRFEAVFNNTYEFMGLLDTDGTLLEANETALRFGGLDRDDVVGRKLWDAYWFQNDDAAQAAAQDGVERARSGALYREEIEVQGADGTEIIDFSIRPITDESGDVTLLVPEGRLITELKEREQHLELLHRFLRHNLRNKMTVIRGSAGALDDELSDPAGEGPLSNIRNAASDIIELSETAHELSTVAMDPDADQRPMDPEAVLRDVLTDVQAAHPDASVRFGASVDCPVRADWRLERICEQLVENAVEHSDAGTPRVDIDVTEREGTVEIAFADNGPGIPDDELRGITTDDEPTQVTHGTGFGLWLVRSVIDDYGGDMAYERHPDGGSVLTVTVPKAAEAQEEAEDHGGTSRSDGARSP